MLRLLVSRQRFFRLRYTADLMRSAQCSLSTTTKTVVRPKAVVFDMVGVYLPSFEATLNEFEAKLGIPKGSFVNLEYKIPGSKG